MSPDNRTALHFPPFCFCEALHASHNTVHHSVNACLTTKRAFCPILSQRGDTNSYQLTEKAAEVFCMARQTSPCFLKERFVPMGLFFFLPRRDLLITEKPLWRNINVKRSLARCRQQWLLSLNSNGTSCGAFRLFFCSVSIVCNEPPIGFLSPLSLFGGCVASSVGSF